MMHTAPLDTDQFKTTKEGEKVFEFEVWSYWYDSGFPVEEIVEAHTVVHEKQDDENTSHIVAKVETLEKPLDIADIVEHKVTQWCCDCRGYQFHYNVDLEEKSVTEWGSCPHIQEVSKEEKAKADDNQDTII